MTQIHIRRRDSIDWSGEHPCLPASGGRLYAEVNLDVAKIEQRNTAEAAVWQARMLTAPVRLEMIEITVNKTTITVEPGTTVAVAILNAGVDHFRTSVTGAGRGPLCGMGICFECCVTINGIPHQRSCTLLAENGMEVETSKPPA